MLVKVQKWLLLHDFKLPLPVNPLFVLFMLFFKVIAPNLIVLAFKLNQGSYLNIDYFRKWSQVVELKS